MSESLAAWNGYAFDVPGGGRMRPVLLGPSEASGLVESGGSEGLASATTDNRPMSIDVYRAPAPGPSAPKPPGQPAIGGRLV